MTKVLRLAVATIGLLVILLPVTGTLSLTFAQAAPATGTWKLTGSMHVARYGHTATLLKNGKVLVAGGSGTTLTSAELYDPTTGKWSLTGSLNVARRFDSPSILLPNGKVLVAGGDDGAGYTCQSSSHGSTSHSTSFTATGTSTHNTLSTVSYTPSSPCFCPHSLKSAELYDPT